MLPPLSESEKVSIDLQLIGHPPDGRI